MCAGNAANLAAAVTNPAGTLQIDTIAPTVSSLAASGIGITNGSGDLNAGHIVTLTVNLSEAVTVANGTPTLTLNDGGTATYSGGSGTNALTFSYTVAAGQNTPDLTVTAVNLGTATVKDVAGNAANLAAAVTNPTGTLQIDTIAPTVSSLAASGIGITNGSGDLNAGHIVTLTVNLSEAVTVANGTPTLTLNDGGTATYSGGSGTNALTFNYTVAAGQNTPALTVTAVNLGSASVMDAAGNAANLAAALTSPTGTLQIDTTAPAAPIIASDTTNANNSVTLQGTAEANSTVTAYDGTTLLGSTTANASGSWTYVTSPLAIGSHTFTATATDAAGNTSAVSNSIDPTIGEISSDNWNKAVSGSWGTSTDWSSGVPVSSDLVNLGSAGTYTVTSTTNETVAELNSIGTAKLDIAGGTFSITNGTGNGVQAGTISVDRGATLNVAGNFDNSGTLLANSGALHISGAVIGGVTEIAGTGTVEFGNASSENVTFLAGSTGQLVLDQATSYTGTVTGFGANTSQSIDLTNIDFASAHFGYAPSSGSGAASNGGVLTVTDGTDTTHIQLNGVYTLANFEIASDGHGGTLLTDPPVVTQMPGNAPASIANGTVLEINTPDQGAVTFAGPTGALWLDQPSTFTGTVHGLSGNDVIDLPGVAFGSDTSESYLPNQAAGTTSANTLEQSAAGNNSGGLLTVSDGTHTDTLSLIGNYTASSFALSSDGHGGTLIADTSPTTASYDISQATSGTSIANGTVTFADTDVSNTQMASFTADGSNYVGAFSIKSASENNGNATVGFEFSLGNDQINLAPGQTLTQSYNISFTDAQNTAHNLNQIVSVSYGAPGDDNFVFQPGIGADTILNFNPQNDTIELDHFANAQNIQQLQALITTDAHGDAFINLGHNDSITLPGMTAAELHQVLATAVHLH